MPRGPMSGPDGERECQTLPMRNEQNTFGCADGAKVYLFRAAETHAASERRRWQTIFQIDTFRRCKMSRNERNGNRIFAPFSGRTDEWNTENVL